MTKNKKQTDTAKRVWSTSAFLCGIISIIIFIMPYFSIPLGIMGLVSYKYSDKTLGKSIAGLITSIIGIAIGGMLTLFMLIYFGLVGYFM